MNAFNQSHEMLLTVAKALGKELLNDVAFLGGCATGLLLTDEATKESVRYTDDVDLITHVIGFSGWINFQKRIKNRGFKESMEDNINCRMRLGDLIVDFMPDDKNILGYSNRWYPEALARAEHYMLLDMITINLVTPVYFIATKLEAFKGRGNNDLLHSRDIEDILSIFDGRGKLVDEIRQADLDVKGYIILELSRLLEQPDFAYVIQSTSQGQPGREEIIFSRIEAVIDAASG